MSFPNIPDVTPTISVGEEQAKNLLLASVAFEELGLAHIINAEAEKVQYVFGTLEGQSPPTFTPTIADLLEINDSVNRTLKTVIKKEMLLQFKLEDIASLSQVCVSSTFDFPSENSDVSPGFVDSDEVGYFWSVNNGDHISQTFTASEFINKATLEVEVVANYLAPGAFVDWELVINGVPVGSFRVESGFAGKITTEFAFPKIMGPVYDVDLRVTNNVPDGAGSMTLAYASDFAHAITLTYCNLRFTEVRSTAVTEMSARSLLKSLSQPEYSLQVNNRNP